MQNLQDTLRVIDRPAAIILPADTLHAPEADTAQTVPQHDTTLTVPAAVQPSEIPDSLVLTDTDSAVVAAPAARLPAVETGTFTAQPVKPAAPFQDTGALHAAEKIWDYDASYYLDGRKDKDYFEFFKIGSKDSGLKELNGSRPVFVETLSPTAPEGSAAYETYLSSGTVAKAGAEVRFTATWVPALVILSFLLLTWIKLIYLQFLTPVLVSTFNYKEAFKLYQSRNVPAQNAFLILHLIFAINSGLFLLYVSWHFDLDLPGLHPALIFAMASAVVVLLFALKSLFLHVAGFLFDRPKLFAEYSHNIALYNKILGLLLLPVIIGLLYGGDYLHGIFIYTGLAMGVVFYLLQLVRGVEIILKKEFSLFYLFLYLCAFEILPILVLYKLFQVLLM